MKPKLRSARPGSAIATSHPCREISTGAAARRHSGGALSVDMVTGRRGRSRAGGQQPTVCREGGASPGGIRGGGVLVGRVDRSVLQQFLHRSQPALRAVGDGGEPVPPNVASSIIRPTRSSAAARAAARSSSAQARRTRGRGAAGLRQRPYPRRRISGRSTAAGGDAPSCTAVPVGSVSSASTKRRGSVPYNTRMGVARRSPEPDCSRVGHESGRGTVSCDLLRRPSGGKPADQRCPRQDSNLRPSAPEADALSPELRGRRA